MGTGKSRKLLALSGQELGRCLSLGPERVGTQRRADQVDVTAAVSDAAVLALGAV